MPWIVLPDVEAFQGFKIQTFALEIQSLLAKFGDLSTDIYVALIVSTIS